MIAFEPQVFTPTFTPTSNNEVKTYYEAILKDFQANKHKEVIDTSKKILSFYPHEIVYVPQIQLLLGMSYFQQANYSAAIQALEQVIPVEDEHAQNLPFLAKYYRAIAHNKLDDKASAKQLFEQLVQEAPSTFVEQYQLKQWINALK